VFDQEIMVQALCFGFRIGEVPVPTRYFPEASSVGFRRSVDYGFAVLWLVVRYVLHRLHLVRSRQFTARLEDILAPRHREAILRTR
ncbi:MAG TPA: glycosyltransferase family 2 protein, partial [Chloroflexota bacterium]|nr:glycosyltransferase family 2 protein [Chloroflexota bacterium]